MYGFDTSDGSQLFYDQQLEQTSNWTPAYDGSSLYTFCDGNLRSHDPSTGTEEWEVAVPGNFYTYEMNTAPVLSDGLVYVLDDTGIYAIDVDAEELVWSADGSFSGVPTVANGLVYAITSGEVKVYDKDDGTYSGVYIAGNSIGGQAIVTDDLLIVSGDYAASTYVFDLSSGETITKLPHAGTVAVSDGRLFIATDEELRGGNPQRRRRRPLCAMTNGCACSSSCSPATV